MPTNLYAALRGLRGPGARLRQRPDSELTARAEKLVRAVFTRGQESDDAGLLVLDEDDEPRLVDPRDVTSPDR